MLPVASTTGQDDDDDFGQIMAVEAAAWRNEIPLGHRSHLFHPLVEQEFDQQQNFIQKKNSLKNIPKNTNR